jgi:moderate conductance mechanosensitive channel
MSRPMTWKDLRGWLLVLAIGLCTIAPAAAQTSAPSAPAAPTTEQLQQLVTTLKDDKARNQLVAELQALIAAQNAQQNAKSSSPFTWLSDLPSQLDAIGSEILATAPIFVQAPHLIAWVSRELGDPEVRQRWLDVALKLLAIFSAGIVADLIAHVLLRRPAARALAVRTSEKAPIRILLLLVGAVVEALPALIFAAVALFVMPLTEPHAITRGIAGVVIAATVWARGSLAVARVMLLSPTAPTLVDLTEETRNYVYIWIRRFVHWAAFGYAASVCAWWLGMPGPMSGLLMRVTVLVLAVLAIIFVLQNRTPVREWLRGQERTDDNGWRVLRNRLAETWHILAIVYVVGTFGIYVLNAEGGLSLLLRATALSLIVITTAAVLVRFIEQMLTRGFAVKPELRARFPALEARANRYTPILRLLCALTIYVFAALAVLQAWGIEAFDWLSVLAQQPATRRLVSLALVIIGGLILWELFSSMVERRLAAIDYAGRSRARTLLPLLRTTVLIILVTIAALMILSELGLNIAPLLAGAGIAGIAVGFGSQALVKDVITGFFILLEDTFAVGDLVDVGKGHVGMIEAMSIRNFRLRDVAGIVHTVPFSEVTSVLNMSRDFAYVVCDAGILYREDPDRAIAAMRAAGKDIAEDKQWSRYILAPLEILGIDRFTDTGMVIRARLKAAPPYQMELGREFNRRLKKAFDEHGIAMASVNQVTYLDAVQQAAAEKRRDDAAPKSV